MKELRRLVAVPFCGIGAGRFKDNPRRLGKGRARLVGTVPL